MRFGYFSTLVMLTFLVSCGEDVSSNRRKGSTGQERNRSEVSGAGGTDGTRSQIHRVKAAPVLSYAEEIARTLNNTLSDVLYRIRPDMEIDDEGSLANVLTVSNLGRPTVNCGTGTNLAGIDSRITDCFQKNGNSALWEGSRYGAAGEGIWKLVSRTPEREIWLDMRTGMIWSDVMKIESSTSFNWCQASGNTENDTPTATIDCNALAAGVSVCVGANDPDINVNVRWRLPTRNDFLQADINGARFVLKPESSLGLWTATMKAGVTGRTDAWIYKSADGTLISDNLSGKHHVRCIGAPVR